MFNDLTSSRTTPGRGGDTKLPAAITDVGCERELNEDRYAVVETSVGRAWVVCDGMGGTLGGELAAQLAIDAIRRGLNARQFSSAGEALQYSVQEANRIIVLRRQNPAFSAMGTTVVSAVIEDDHVVITSVGDSRAYLVRERQINQLTTDHTYVQDLVSRGLLDPSEALSHPQAHVLTRCLGADPGLEVTLQEYWLWPSENAPESDYLVLCTDGLYSLVSDEEIADHVNRLTPQECCVQLVELAKKRGGYDNITIAVLPLSGTLREESPGPRKGPTSNPAMRAPMVPKEDLPLQQLLLLAAVLFLLGGVVATFISLLML